MPSSVDTAEQLEALFIAAEIKRIRQFVERDRLEYVLRDRVLPILGVRSLQEAPSELFEAIMHMLQIASMYQSPLDATSPASA